MTNEELKQRMIELLDGYYEETGVGFVHYLTDEECEMIADHLIANGVTIRERGEWQQNPYYKSIYYCSKCGRHIEDGSDNPNPQEHFPYCICGADMWGMTEPPEAEKGGAD